MAGVKHGLRSRGSFNIEMKLEGQWLRLKSLLRDFGPRVMIIAAGAQRKFAENYRDKVKTNIRTGGRRFGYPPHSTAYSNYKRRYGGPSRLLTWSGSMEDAVSVLNLTGGRTAVGIPNDAMREAYHGREGSLLSIAEYANILERGSPSRNIPPRPVFSDTFKEHMGGIRGLRTYMEWHIVRSFAKEGIMINKM